MSYGKSAILISDTTLPKEEIDEIKENYGT